MEELEKGKCTLLLRAFGEIDENCEPLVYRYLVDLKDPDTQTFQYGSIKISRLNTLWLKMWLGMTIYRNGAEIPQYAHHVLKAGCGCFPLMHPVLEDIAKANNLQPSQWKEYAEAVQAYLLHIYTTAAARTGEAAPDARLVYSNYGRAWKYEILRTFAPFADLRKANLQNLSGIWDLKIIRQIVERPDLTNRQRVKLLTEIRREFKIECATASIPDEVTAQLGNLNTAEACTLLIERYEAAAAYEEPEAAADAPKDTKAEAADNAPKQPASTTIDGWQSAYLLFFFERINNAAKGHRLFADKYTKDNFLRDVQQADFSTAYKTTAEYDTPSIAFLYLLTCVRNILTAAEPSHYNKPTRKPKQNASWYAKACESIGCTPQQCSKADKSKVAEWAVIAYERMPVEKGRIYNLDN